MDEGSLLDVTSNTELGIVEIAPEVIEVITGIAASEVEGILAIRVIFAADVVELFGKKSHSKCVKVEFTDTGILIDLYVVLDFGVSIPKTAEKLQTNIRLTIKNMTALDINEINVHVVGIKMEQDNPEEDE